MGSFKTMNVNKNIRMTCKQTDALKNSIPNTPGERYRGKKTWQNWHINVFRCYKL